jgi:hypothetical protein
MACYSDRDNELGGFMKAWKFLGHLSDYQLLKKDFVAWSNL